MENGQIRNSETTNGTSEAMARLQQEALLHRLRGKLKEFQTTIIDDVQNKVKCMIDEVIKDMQHSDIDVNEFKGLINTQQEIWANRHKIEQKEKGKKLPDKIFTARDSPFTCLYRVPHVNTIYHTFLVILIVIVLNTTIHDFVTEGVINFGQNTINAGMRGFWQAIGVWCIMQLSVFLVYYGLRMWADVRQQVKKNDSIRQLLDTMYLILFVSYQLFFMFAVSYTVVRLDLAFVPGSSILIEMTRFIMKMHAFVRTNVPRVLEGKLKLDLDDKSSTEQEQATVPKLSQFVYYLFAPTFIYRDSYPRTSKINWSFALCRLLEVVGVMFFMANIHERYIRTNFYYFGLEQITAGDLIIKLFSMILPGFLIFLSGWYCVLHAWLNFTAEVLRFADRMYYKDWWTSGNFDVFYRNWNIVVHDWLYEYIYKDFYQYIFRRSKTASSIMVFLISAFIHELILGVAFKFFLPVMFAFFGVFGIIIVFLTRKINKTAGNIFLWWALSTGNGLMVSFYAIEHYARQNCPMNDDSWLEYVIPVSLSCNGIQ